MLLIHLIVCVIGAAARKRAKKKLPPTCVRERTKNERGSAGAGAVRSLACCMGSRSELYKPLRTWTLFCVAPHSHALLKLATVVQ